MSRLETVDKRTGVKTFGCRPWYSADPGDFPVGSNGVIYLDFFYHIVPLWLCQPPRSEALA